MTENNVPGHHDEIESITNKMSSLHVHANDCTQSCETLRRMLHALVDARCDSLINMSNCCNDTHLMHAVEKYNGCIHTGTPHVHINRRTLAYTRLFIHNIAHVSFGYTIIDIPDHCISYIMELVARDKSQCPFTWTYTKDHSGCIVVAEPRIKCTKERGKHKHIPASLLNVYATCHDFKRVLDDMFLK